MTATDIAMLVVPSVLGTGGMALGFAVKVVFASRKQQGERLGRLEKEADERRGYERGFKEGRRASRAR